jgi:hypothetical protein
MIALLLALALVLAACGGDDGDDNEEDEAPGVSQSDLTQEVDVETITGGLLTVKYPADWFGTVDGARLVLANSQAALNAETDFTAGQVQANIIFQSPDMLPSPQLIDDGPSETLLTIIVVNNARFATFPDLSDPVPFVTNGKAAAIASGQTPVEIDGEILAATWILVEVDGGYVLLTFAASQGGLADYDALMRAIAGSVQYIPPF